MTSYCEVCQQLFHIQQPQPCSLHSTADQSQEETPNATAAAKTRKSVSPHNRHSASKEKSTRKHTTNVRQTTPGQLSAPSRRSYSLSTPSPLPRRQVSPLSRPPALPHQSNARGSSSPQTSSQPSPSHTMQEHTKGKKKNETRGRERRRSNSGSSSSRTSEDATAVLEDIVARLRAAVRTTSVNSSNNRHTTRSPHKHHKHSNNNIARNKTRAGAQFMSDVVQTPDTPPVHAAAAASRTRRSTGAHGPGSPAMSSASTSLPSSSQTHQTTRSTATSSSSGAAAVAATNTIDTPPSTVQSTSEPNTQHTTDSHSAHSTSASHADTPVHTNSTRTSVPVLYKQMQLRQASFQRELENRVDELREGFVALCAAIEKDMQHLLHTQQEQNNNSNKVSHTRRQDARGNTCGASEGSDEYASTQTWSAAQLITALEAATPAQRIRIASLLFHASHANKDKEENGEEAQQRRTMEGALAKERAYVRQECGKLREELRRVMAEQTWNNNARALNRSSEDKENAQDTMRQGGAAALADASALLPSQDVLAMHIRAAVRTILSEHDALGQRRLASLEQSCDRRFRAQRESCTAALAEQAAQLEEYVQDALAREVRHAVRTHTEALGQRLCEMESRQAQMHTQLQRLGAEGAERSAQCEAEHAVQHKAQDALKQDLAALRQLVSRSADVITATSSDGELVWRRAAEPRGVCSEGGEQVEHYANADSIRLEVVEPALAYVKRLLAAHQEMVNTLVERRCAQTEGHVVQGRLQWDQQVSELRARLQSLRYDTRNAFAELSQTLNIACPGI